jgi:hypothetical protein
MRSDSFLQSRWVKIIVAVFFFLAGAFVTLFLMLAAPSFWYVPCGILWALSGFVWLFRPSFAAGISVFPVLGIAVMAAQDLPHFKLIGPIYWVLIFCVLIAVTLVATAFRQREARKVMASTISFSLVLTAFAVDRLFTNKIEVHSYSMNWSVNGTAPWGRVQVDERGEPPVVIYRMVNQGYCYDALFSPELKAQLTASGKPVVTVDYNVFSDFGRERSYNIRAVDGMLFSNGFRTLQSEGNGYGGYVQNSSGSGDCHR